jgi:osmotically-inducible protein OsmY
MKCLNLSKALGVLLLTATPALWGVFNLSLAQQDKDRDSTVKGAVENKLHKDGILVNANVQVTVQNKVITLQGTIQTLAQGEQAVLDTSSVGKGFRIENNLVLAKTDLTAEQVAQSVMKAINTSDSYGIFDWVGLEASKEGEVTLEGWVFLPLHRGDFIKIAKGTPGVTKVVDKLKSVFTLESDNRIRIQTARLIYNRPAMRDFAHSPGPIHILVDNDVVTLVGTVKTLGDRSVIENLVRNNSGARGVINELEAKEQ